MYLGSNRAILYTVAANKDPGRVRAAIGTQAIRLASDDFITSNLLSQRNCYSVWIMSILLPLILLPKSLRLVLVWLSLPFLAKAQFVVDCAPLLRSQHSSGLLLPSNSRQKCMWCAPVSYSLVLCQVQLQWIFKKSGIPGTVGGSCGRMDINSESRSTPFPLMYQ